MFQHNGRLTPVSGCPYGANAMRGEERSQFTMEAGSEAVVLILGQSANYGGSFPGRDPALSILAAQVEGV